MDKELLDSNVEESLQGLIAVIKMEYEKSPAGRLKGYLVRNPGHCILQKKEVKSICCVDADAGIPFDRGSVIYCEPETGLMWTLGAMVTSYAVRYKLEAAFQDYNFKKFQIRSERFVEYKCDKTKLWRYSKTGYEVPFFKVDIEW